MLKLSIRVPGRQFADRIPCAAAETYVLDRHLKGPV
jgi:hypothetical protein